MTVTSGTRPAKQARSQRTQEKLIAAGFKLLEGKDFDAISVGEVAKAANCSVGAMYDRFANKEAFFHALVDRLAADRRDRMTTPYLEHHGRDVPRVVITEVLEWVRANRNLWRAALRKGQEDPVFWTPFRELARMSWQQFLRWVEQERGRPPTDAEAVQIGFAFQMVTGTINNSFINRPGPLDVDDPAFLDYLFDAFVRVARLEDLV